ncbi:MAG: hypothetical protein GAK28_04241 [Luteibacter sp.]|uniref:DUF3313 domain-containing protein n=1 Tax=Luteibacter sp. TaxID=1886636 RepID=UPI001382D2AC|nr:DUF3313 domain-containing protein [Luteibacter sp.]KAF1004077.1 MAG: hypothetical protein GAK28_04241 [Luteibacter sp.]
MSATLRPATAIVLVSIALIGGCPASQPKPYQQLDSSHYLRPGDDGGHGHKPYAYNDPDVDWKRYDSIVIDPVMIYRGDDAQFDKVSDADKQELADYMRDTFGARLRERYPVVATPSDGTLRVHLTLTGAAATPAVASKVTRMDLVGAPINAVQAIRGREGLFMGSVSYAVEIYDARDQRLLAAYVDKQYPNAMSMASTFGKLTASKRGIDKGADALLATLR